MVNGFVGTWVLIRRVERGGRRTISSWLLGCAAFELVALLVFALAGSPWVAIAAVLGVFLARNLAGPLYTIWLNEQITDSSVRATVLSISGQADAIGQAGGGPGARPRRQPLGHPRGARRGRCGDRAGPRPLRDGRRATRAASRSSIRSRLR